jgi:enediyne biosynthesis protein E4
MISEAANDPRNDGTELRAMLVPAYSQLGRDREAERVVEARWEYLNSIGEGASEEAILQLQRHLVLTLRPNSIENIRTFLDVASQRAPQDDRVWLGRANLATRMGDYDNAKRHLDPCLEHRPDDVPVWRARLDWGVAANRIEAVKEALPHLPAADSTPAQIYRLSAWFCARERR